MAKSKQGYAPHVNRSINKYVAAVRCSRADYGIPREVCEIRGGAKLVDFGAKGNGAAR